jgi:hypothetical protein
MFSTGDYSGARTGGRAAGGRPPGPLPTASARYLRAMACGLTAAGVVLGSLAGAGAAAAATAGPAAPGQTVRPGAPSPIVARAGHDYRSACPAARPGHAQCLALIRTDVRPHLQPVGHPDVAPVGDGYGPGDLQSAYNLPSAANGNGQTVAVVDAYDDANAASNLATYRSAWGQPACNTATGAGCVTVVNQNGQASPLPQKEPSGDNWALEESLDLDMVSAICPNCKILLVEANSTGFSDLGTAVNTAVRLGAKYVSNSYGGGDFQGENSYDTYYDHPGVAVTASAGDGGYGVEYPAASPYVTSVGGTSLSTSSSGRGWTETAWSSSGSGCSGYEAKPGWQSDTGCTRRTDNDVAAVADPNTGVAVYDTADSTGWVEEGGTSAASPIIAATYALAGPPVAGTNAASYIYQHTSGLYDVTSGSDGTCTSAYLCTGEVGYDGPTGWGTPDGIGAFTALAGQLPQNGRLSAGEGLVSPNGAYRLIMQTDGNLVEYGPSGATWATSTSGSGNYVIMQTDMNLVVYSSSGHPLWQSGTCCHSGSFSLVLQNNGTMAIEGSGGAVQWATTSSISSGSPKPELLPGQQITSGNGAYRLIMQQSDGNLVEYGPSGAIWATGPQGSGQWAYLQNDGDLVVFSASGSVVWQSHNAGPVGVGYTLSLQNDGNLVIYSPTGVLWAR